MENRILFELTEIKLASDKMVKHIDFVEKHINWVQQIIKFFVPTLTRYFQKIEEPIPFDDIV